MSVGSCRWRAAAPVQCVAIAVVQVLCLGTWFSASAVVPTLEDQWGISNATATWLTASTQVGFVVGAVVSAVVNLADRISPVTLLTSSAVGAALVTFSFAGFATGMGVGVPLRFATGVFLAGVYPVGMKLMTSWASSRTRGLAMGLLIGALTIGTGLPHVVGVLDWGWRALMSASATLTLVGAAICMLVVRVGPQLSGPRTEADPRYALTLFTDRRARLINLGYLGHMWELYALWTWMPMFAVHALEQRGGESTLMGLAVFVSIGPAGLVGALVGGWSADRWGRSRTATAALVVSGLCCVLSPLVFEAGPWVLMVLGVVWGASVIADSGVLSTMLSEAVDTARTGTALTTQTAAGFLLTVVSIQLVPLVARGVGWQFALSVLTLGPLLGVLALSGLRRQPAVMAR